jgi:tRNA modification GTPase
MPAMSIAAAATIVALATHPGRAAIGVVRLSGPEAWAIAGRCFQGRRGVEAWVPYQALHGWWHDPATQEPIDEVLVLPFRGPKSFTGEDVVEIHGHGNPALLQRLIETCTGLGAVPATRGEFTRRALLNGRMDLPQAEALLTLIEAEGEQQLRLARHHLRTRSLNQTFEGLRAQLIDVQMRLVAHIDFPDEVDEPDTGDLLARFAALYRQAQDVAQVSQQTRLVREGMKLALVGLPNAGKSSLFNAMLLTERAIVTDIPGTTRDVLTETLLIHGVPVTLLDTAGIRDATDTGETLDRVEAMGIARSRASTQEADAVVVVVDAADTRPEVRDATNRLLADLPPDTPRLLILNHWDRVSGHDAARAFWAPLTTLGLTVLTTSAPTRQGVPELLSALGGLIQTQVQLAQRHEALTTLSHRQTTCLTDLLEHLDLAQTTLTSGLPLDLLTVPLTGALHAIDRLLGRDATEEVLDAVFSEFCVGK